MRQREGRGLNERGRAISFPPRTPQTSQLFSTDVDSIRMSHSRSRPIMRLANSRLKYNDVFWLQSQTGGFLKEFIKYSFHRPIDKIPEYYSKSFILRTKLEKLGNFSKFW